MDLELSTTAAISSPPPPQPQGACRKQEMPVTRACWGDRERGALYVQPLQPLNLRAARLHLADQRGWRLQDIILQTREGWVCCAPFSKPGSSSAKHTLLILVFKTLPEPGCLSFPPPLPPQHTPNVLVSVEGVQTNVVRLPAQPLQADRSWTSPCTFCCLSFLIFTLEMKIPSKSPF